MIEAEILSIKEGVRVWEYNQGAYGAIGIHYERISRGPALRDMKLDWQGDPLSEQQKLRSEW